MYASVDIEINDSDIFDAISDELPDIQDIEDRLDNLEELARVLKQINRNYNYSRRQLQREIRRNRYARYSK